MPPEVPGVYVLQLLHGGSFVPVYVGQTDDLRVRLTTHLRTAAAKPALRAVRHRASAYFSAATVAERRTRLQCESGLIRSLNPLFNLQVPRIAPLFPPPPPMRLPWLNRSELQ